MSRDVGGCSIFGSLEAGLESRIQEDWLIWAKWESLRVAGEVGELKEESQQIVHHQTCLSPQSVLGKAGGQTAQGDPIHPGKRPAGYPWIPSSRY